MRSLFRRSILSRLALLAVVELGFCLALMASVSPELHKHLHHDADESGHECLITTLISGGVDGAPAVIIVLQPPVPPPTLLIESPGIASYSFFLECSVFEHGPPIF